MYVRIDNRGSFVQKTNSTNNKGHTRKSLPESIYPFSQKIWGFKVFSTDLSIHWEIVSTTPKWYNRESCLFPLQSITNIGDHTVSSSRLVCSCFIFFFFFSCLGPPSLPDRECIYIQNNPNTNDRRTARIHTATITRVDQGKGKRRVGLDVIVRSINPDTPCIPSFISSTRLFWKCFIFFRT